MIGIVDDLQNPIVISYVNNFEKANENISSRKKRTKTTKISCTVSFFWLQRASLVPNFFFSTLITFFYSLFADLESKNIFILSKNHQ